MYDFDYLYIGDYLIVRCIEVRKLKNRLEIFNDSIDKLGFSGTYQLPYARHYNPLLNTNRT